MLHNESLFEPLVSLCTQSATGSLARCAWEQRIDELRVCHVEPRVLKRHETRELWDVFRRRLLKKIPPGAHEMRIRAALPLAPPPTDGAEDTNASLTKLMMGAVACDARAIQLELLDRFRELSTHQSPEGEIEGISYDLVSTLQAPLLARVRAPEAEALPALPALSTADSVTINEVEAFLLAAELARTGNQPGSKHGCVILEDGGRLLGAGSNHYVQDRQDNNKKRVTHAEAHAVADAIRRRGEDAAFAAFPRATAWIVELQGDVSYDAAQPCMNCQGMLRAVGMREVRYTSGTGRLVTRVLGEGRPDLLKASVCIPMRISLREETGVVLRR